jgi:D-glycero-beta-D-manno-heptose 1-phosphate adenylyltransferase
MIVELKELLELLEKVRGKKKIVFTNGCFDILHAGHADYLNKAKSLGIFWWWASTRTLP